MDKRTRICLWVIVIGLANFVAYTIVYMAIGGEAVGGYIEFVRGDPTPHYVLNSGHGVGRAMYIYSGVHSISIWLTVAAVMLAMLTLAKERIVSSMHSAIVRGRTFITIMATLITFITIVITIWFIIQFCKNLDSPRHVEPAPKQAVHGDVPVRPASAEIVVRDVGVPPASAEGILPSSCSSSSIASSSTPQQQQQQDAGKMPTSRSGSPRLQQAVVI